MPAVPFRFRFLRLFFQLLYNQFAWTYDLVAWLVSIGKWQTWVKTSLPYLKGPFILELGHGPGHLQAAVQAQGLDGLRVIGLDASIYMGRLAARNLRKRGLLPRLVNGKGQQLPFASGIFQQVVATFPTEYIIAPETLSEIYRVLATGGTFVVIPGAWITGKQGLDRAAAWLFQVTGQAPQWDERYLQPLIKVGFQTQTQFVELASSLVLVVLASKPDLAVQ